MQRAVLDNGSRMSPVLKPLPRRAPAKQRDGIVAAQPLTFRGIVSQTMDGVAAAILGGIAGSGVVAATTIMTSRSPATAPTLRRVPVFQPAAEDGPPTRIPKIVMQTFNTRFLTNGMAEAFRQFRKNNPEFEFRFFDDHACELYLEKHFGQRFRRAFRAIRPGAYRADFFRYCFVWQNGGIYIDCGIVPEVKLIDVIHEDTTLLLTRDIPSRVSEFGNGLWNAVFGAVPRHPIVGNAIAISLARVEAAVAGPTSLWMTGPLAFGRALELWVMHKRVLAAGDPLVDTCRKTPDSSVSAYHVSERLLHTDAPPVDLSELLGHKGDPPQITSLETDLPAPESLIAADSKVRLPPKACVLDDMILMIHDFTVYYPDGVFAPPKAASYRADCRYLSPLPYYNDMWMRGDVFRKGECWRQGLDDDVDFMIPGCITL
jgi:hypothetical protein